jgi:hypothetical protein
MPTHTRSLAARAAPDTIWRLWSNPSTWPSWNPDVVAMRLDGPFAVGTRGVMQTTHQTLQVELADVQPGRSFRLETTPIPLTRFAFECRVEPKAESDSATISQSLSMRGPLAPIFSRLMARQIADSFVPLLRGLAAAAERAEQGGPSPS